MLIRVGVKEGMLIEEKSQQIKIFPAGIFLPPGIHFRGRNIEEYNICVNFTKKSKK